MAECRTALFVGLGSIGKRHLANYHAVANRLGFAVEVDALRHGGARPDDHGGQLRNQFCALSEVQACYDHVFICNPTQLHVRTLFDLAERGRSFFIEKPLAPHPLSVAEVAALGDVSCCYVACPLRHSDTYAALRRFVAENRVLAVRATCSSYLPSWRPGVDYSQIYAARADSGGVAVDLIHDFDYLFDLFDQPEKCAIFEAKVSSLKIDCPDVAAVAARCRGMSLELHLDYFGRKAERVARIWTDDDVVDFDFIACESRSLVHGWSRSLGDGHDMYMREMDYFLHLAEGKERNMNDLARANRLLEFIAKNRIPNGNGEGNDEAGS